MSIISRGKAITSRDFIFLGRVATRSIDISISFTRSNTLLFITKKAKHIITFDYEI